MSSYEIIKTEKLRNKKKDKVKDGYRKVAMIKSFNESSKSFVSPDYADKSTWYYSSTDVINEIAIDSGDHINYTFADINKIIINLSKITDREDWQNKKIVIKKNDIEITSGYTIDYSDRQIIFDSTNQASDEVKISYSYENGSMFEIISFSSKKILVDYVETQFSESTTFNDILIFEMILNNPNTGNTDYIVGKTEYHNAKDFLNKGNHGSILQPFGELQKKVNVFPWNYLTGFTIKPIGDVTTDPFNNEFNKLRMYLKNDQPYTNCELATGTFYCLIEDL